MSGPRDTNIARGRNAARTRLVNAAPARSALKAEVLRVLTAAADAGAPCPSWHDLGRRAGASEYLAAAVAHELVHEGLIAFDGSMQRRTVTIVATGRASAPLKPLARTAKAVGLPQAPPPPMAVDRTPCPWCGARADIGCRCGVRTTPAQRTLGGVGSSML